MRRALSFALLLTGATGLPAQAPRDTLIVFAAADLSRAFEELGARYRALTGIAVTLVLNSSGTLALQIEQGAPADLFFAANVDYVRRLSEQHLVLPGSVTRYARGELVLAWPVGASVAPRRLEDLLRDEVRRIAIANPDHAPYGQAAREALTAAGMWDRLQPKVVLGENVRQAVQYVQTDAVEAGLVSRALADTPELAWVPVDPRLYNPLDQAAGVIATSGHSRAAAEFLAFVIGADGWSVMERYGFERPSGP